MAGQRAQRVNAGLMRNRAAQIALQGGAAIAQGIEALSRGIVAGKVRRDQREERKADRRESARRFDAQQTAIQGRFDAQQTAIQGRHEDVMEGQRASRRQRFREHKAASSRADARAVAEQKRFDAETERVSNILRIMQSDIPSEVRAGLQRELDAAMPASVLKAGVKAGAKGAARLPDMPTTEQFVVNARAAGKKAQALEHLVEMKKNEAKAIPASRRHEAIPIINGLMDQAFEARQKAAEAANAAGEAVRRQGFEEEQAKRERNVPFFRRQLISEVGNEAAVDAALERYVAGEKEFSTFNKLQDSLSATKVSKARRDAAEGLWHFAADDHGEALGMMRDKDGNIVPTAQAGLFGGAGEVFDRVRQLTADVINGRVSASDARKSIEAMAGKRETDPDVVSREARQREAISDQTTVFIDQAMKDFPKDGDKNVVATQAERSAQANQILAEIQAIFDPSVLTPDMKKQIAARVKRGLGIKD